MSVRVKTKDIGVLELVRESLVAVVKEMRANIIHSSYSSIIYEGHDFSCALVSADGRLLAQSLDDNPLHIFAVPHSAREIIRVFGGDIHEGDVFLHNDPYTGGTHLNDVLMLYPVFDEGRLVLFAAARCHWGDVGGSTPGSLSGRVTEILQEGIRIVPTRICEKGKLNEPFLELLFQNMRNPAERQGDFKTMLGTSRKAAEHVKRLIARFGADKMLSSIEELMRRSEQVMRERIKVCPDGVYHAEGYIESNGNDHEPIVARLKLTIDGDRARCVVYMQAEHFLNDAEPARRFVIGGYYTDELVRDGDQWKIVAVTLKVLWTRGDKSFMDDAHIRGAKRLGLG